MSWTDKQSIKVMKYLRDKFNINTFVETGTYKGINARLHSNNFENVFTCENHNAYYEEAKINLSHYKNIIVFKEDSPIFLGKLSLGKYMFYLDAHFYDESLPKGKGKFVVLKELDNMENFKDSIIIIHDFCNGLGGINYDGIDLDMDLIKDKLLKINPNFYFYTNKLDSCDIVKPNAEAIKEAGLEVDFDTLRNLDYAWQCPRLTYRGILYCLPTKLDSYELKILGLRKWN